MSIEKTKIWLEEHFDEPIKICSKLVSSSNKEDAVEFYDYLVSFGMYQPNPTSREMFHQLKDEDSWSKVENIYVKYKIKWSGPDIPVYIFPMRRTRYSKIDHKSGVSFANKMFLFLTPLLDVRELEALIVHEYHHICRLKYLTKPYHEFTLLDSILMEGFAEYAVTKFCGKNYNAKWTSYYNNEELEYFWEKYLMKNLQAKKTEPIHDAILFGKGRFPDLMGYAAGYQIINLLYKKKSFTFRETFTIKEDEVMKVLDSLF